MTQSIHIYAGKTALKKIREQGFQQHLFDGMAGASGGPKWFTLFGLDKYIFGEFFKYRQQPIYTISSSAGSWRMACFAQKNPVAAVERLAHYYSNETYSEKPNVDEISDKAITMLDRVLGETGAAEIADNPIVQSHFLVAKATGLNAIENKVLQLLGLVFAATANSFSRNNIAHFFERFIFHSQNPSFQQSYFQPTDLPTQYVPLVSDNVRQVLLASGAIPLVLRGIKHIKNAPQGTYRDGGIIDYHLDLNFNGGGLILYPHFFPTLKPGWFDKSLKRRSVNSANYENVVVITPSHSHVANLPYQKISDRNDFTQMEQTERIKYWQTVLDESHRMADDFQHLVENGNELEKIIPIESILK